MARSTTSSGRSGERGLAGFLRYRELLANLVRKELKVKYKNSVLGFVWTMLNPALYLVVFYLVFQVFLGAGIPRFYLYLLTGLLAWNFFSMSLVACTTSLVGNADLIRKVYFPREMLPLSAVGGAGTHILFQATVLLAVVAVSRQPIWGANLLLLPLAVAVEVVVVVGLGLFVSAMNVRFRDTQHLVELALVAWFWMTPVVYASAWVQQTLVNKTAFGVNLWQIYLLNPLTPVALGFQRALYGQVFAAGADGKPIPVLVDAPLGWYAKRLLVTGGMGIVVLALALVVFRRLETAFAEEL